MNHADGGRADELPPPLRAALGASSLPWRYELTSTALRAYARAAGYVDLVYYHLDTARAAGFRDLPAPPGFLGAAVYVPGLSDEVFSEPSFGQPEVPHGLPRVLDLGTDTEHLTQLHAGDVLLATTTVVDIRPRSDGLLVVREIVFTDECSGAVVARQRRSTLYLKALS